MAGKICPLLSMKEVTECKGEECAWFILATKGMCSMEFIARMMPNLTPK